MGEQELEDDAENAVIAKSRARVQEALSKPVNPEHVLMLGFGMCAYGLLTGQIWMILGGFMFFFLGVQKVGGRNQGERGDLKTP